MATYLRSALIVLIKGYRWIGPGMMMPCCRFEPSCSTYALEAVRMHGLIRGGWLTVKRLLRCHPWHPGGVDPVIKPKREVN